MPRAAMASVATPIGWLSLEAEAGAITALRWRVGSGGAGRREEADADAPLLSEAARQLEAYFAGRLERFGLPLRPAGGTLQRRVSEALRAIPFGRTREYGEIARELDAAPQAVGAACGANTIAIIVPCHRVVGAGGLGGFSAPGGVETKVALLRHEGAYALLI